MTSYVVFLLTRDRPFLGRRAVSPAGGVLSWRVVVAVMCLCGGSSAESWLARRGLNAHHGLVVAIIKR